MTWIALSQGQKTLVDKEMAPFLVQLHWHAHKDYRNGYFYANRVNAEGRPEGIHWYVVGEPMDGYVVDHINGDTLDNRRINLRVVTCRQNLQNRRSHRAGRLVGATWVKRNKKWQAQIRDMNGHKFLGYFKTERAAHNAYLRALRERKVSLVS